MLICLNFSPASLYSTLHVIDTLIMFKKHRKKKAERRKREKINQIHTLDKVCLPLSKFPSPPHSLPALTLIPEKETTTEEEENCAANISIWDTKNLNIFVSLNFPSAMFTPPASVSRYKNIFPIKQLLASRRDCINIEWQIFPIPSTWWQILCVEISLEGTSRMFASIVVRFSWNLRRTPAFACLFS